MYTPHVLLHFTYASHSPPSPMAQAHDPLPTDSPEAPCAHVCLHMWPMQGLVGPYDPHCRVFAVQMQPVRVGAAPIAPQRPKICNLDGPCGVAGSQTRRYAPMRLTMRPRAPQLVVCRAVGRLAHTVAFFGSDVAFACRRRPGFQGGLKLADRLGTCGLGRQT